MQFLQIFEIGEKPPGFGCVMPVALQLRQNFFLLRNVILAFGDMAPGHCKMIHEHRAVHLLTRLVGR